MKQSRSSRRSTGARQAAVGAVMIAVGAGSPAVASTVSAMQFGTVNSATWQLKGMNTTTFGSPSTETLSGPTTFLNPFNASPTDVRTLPSGQGTM